VKQSKNNIEELKRKRDNILKEMFVYRSAIRGSITKIYKMCSNRECECHSTNRKKHGLASYISSSHQGRTRMIYVPSWMEGEAEKRVEAYKKLCELIEELSEVNSEIFKLDKELRKGGSL
jgi:uncharacterized coiled-coil DUF342 family protein